MEAQTDWGIDMVEETSRARRLIGTLGSWKIQRAMGFLHEVCVVFCKRWDMLGLWDDVLIFETWESKTEDDPSLILGQGYCPQFDALIHVMTVESHLYLYGRMKGEVAGQLVRVGS